MKKTVLIVEDNELNMKLFNDLLEAHGYATVQTLTASLRRQRAGFRSAPIRVSRSPTSSR